MKAPNKKCDCLTDCGDDPDIGRFKVQPCLQFARFHLSHPDIGKMVPASVLLPLFQADAVAKLKAAEQAWYRFYAALPVGDDRTRAAAVFENIRNAARVGGVDDERKH